MATYTLHTTGLRTLNRMIQTLDSVNYDISSSELKQWLDGIRCKNVLVVIDACEAEGMLKGGAKEMVTDLTGNSRE